MSGRIIACFHQWGLINGAWVLVSSPGGCAQGYVAARVYVADGVFRQVVADDGDDSDHHNNGPRKYHRCKKHHNRLKLCSQRRQPAPIWPV